MKFQEKTPSSTSSIFFWMNCFAPSLLFLIYIVWRKYRRANKSYSAHKHKFYSTWCKQMVCFTRKPNFISHDDFASWSMFRGESSWLFMWNRVRREFVTRNMFPVSVISPWRFGGSRCDCYLSFRVCCFCIQNFGAVCPCATKIYAQIVPVCNVPSVSKNLFLCNLFLYVMLLCHYLILQKFYVILFLEFGCPKLFR